MSVTISLTAMAVIACASIASSTLSAMLGAENFEEEQMEIFETPFVDSEILVKTLNEHGCCVNAVSENEYVVTTSEGNLRYTRSAVGEPFMLNISEVSNPQLLVENIRSLEFEYGRNVQAYTYSHIMSSLGEDMTFQQEEILEDDSLLLTINIE
jgi:hypothetical protein